MWRRKEQSSAEQRQPKRSSPAHRAKIAMIGARHGVRAKLAAWRGFAQPKKAAAWRRAKRAARAPAPPPLALAATLLHAANNPVARNSGLSTSWLCLFIPRSVVALSLAKLAELVAAGCLPSRRGLAASGAPRSVSFVLHFPALTFLLRPRA